MNHSDFSGFIVWLIPKSYCFVIILELNSFSPPQFTFILLKRAARMFFKNSPLVFYKRKPYKFENNMSVSKLIQNYWVNYPFKSKHVYEY